MANNLSTVKYGGQDVVNDKAFKDYNQVAVDMYNKNTKSNLTPEAYDRMLNPTTAGARWGDAPDTPVTPPAGQTGGGLLNPAASAPAYTPRDAQAVNSTATTYDPTKVAQSGTSSVQNQIANITASGSPLNTLAETSAKKTANSRGLLNSSIAVGAGQEAVLKSALPIAQQDASTSASVDQANAQYANSASQFNAGAQNASSLNNSQVGTQVNLANSAGSNAAASQGAQSALQTSLAQIQANTQLSLADKNNQTNLTIAGNDNATKTLLQSMDSASKLGLANIDADTKVKLANLDAQSKTNLQTMLSNNQQLLQTNISASNIFSQYMTNLANISTNEKMDATAKQQAADNQLNALNAQLQAIGQISGLDLSKYFQKADMSAAPAPAPAPANPNADQG